LCLSGSASSAEQNLAGTQKRKIMSRKYFVIMTAVLSAGLLIWGCAPYTRQVVPFKMPATYSNMTQVAGMQIGAMAYTDPNQGRNAFGFDIRGAGLLPVQVVIDHKGASAIEINPGQTFLVDHQNNLWPVLDKRLAYERVARYNQMIEVHTNAARTGFLGATVGAMIGAAIGIVTNQPVGDAAIKGAAVGGTAGAISGGASALDPNNPSYRNISEDLRNKSLESRPIRPMEIVHGFIFFPGEASSAKELRLQFSEIGTGRFLNVALPL
jgi:hypothetical protein